MLGTVLSSISWVLALIYTTQMPLFIKLVSNLIISSSIILQIWGIGKFLNTKIPKYYWLFFVTIMAFVQFYFLYIWNNYFWRNISLIMLASLAYSMGLKYIITSNISNFAITARCLSVVLFAGICTFLIRGILLIDSPTQFAAEGTPPNVFIFLSLFILGFMQNSCFVLMVSQRMYSELHNIAQMDFLTNLLNRGAMTLKVEEILAINPPKVLSLILLDIDYFKKINDNYGHDVGDLVLQEVARILKSQLHPKDLIGRWGGEEFLIFLPNCTAAMADKRANSLRLEVANTAVYYQSYGHEYINCSISLGVVTTNPINKSLDELIKAADLGLYEAKAKGRNRAEFVVIG
ncbi:hypothetical protein B9T07_19615 [Limnospira fusiformis CCALA 023]